MFPKDILSKDFHFAVIGVSQNKEKYGYKIYQRLKEKNYQTSGISPIYQKIDHEKLYPSLEAIQQPIDVAVFVVNKKYAYNYVDEMLKLNIKYAWMQPNTYDDELLTYMKNVGIIPILACILIETSN